MESIVLCLAAFLAVYGFTRNSFVAGLSAAITVGYFYGIVRANVPQTFSHFIFDAGLGGLYLGIWQRGLTGIQKLRIRKIRGWVLCLIGWPLLLFLIPVQDQMVQLVGLRAAVWFLPLLLIGAIIDDQERSRLAWWLAVLNLVALGFAVAEFSLGLPRFFPQNKVTHLIYIQNDVVVGSTSDFRIPSTFVQPAGYSAAMVMSMPLIIGAWVQEKVTRIEKIVLAAGVVAALGGVFLGASRSQALLLFAQLAALASFAKIRLKHLVAFAALASVAGYWVYNEPRLQRFTNLDFSVVENRVHGSVNESFLDALTQYPMGNGLGGGGTSVLYFLQDRIENSLVIENEYGRILLELGIPGLLLWLVFVITAVGTAPSERAGPWRIGWRLARVTVLLYFATGFIGLGLMTSIPNTCLLLFMTGWLFAPRLRPFTISVDEPEPWFEAHPAR